MAQVDALKRIDGVSALPASLRVGLAEPNAPFNGGDARDPNLPNERLVFAACSPSVCVVHYETGGLAGPNYLLDAYERRSGEWKPIWRAEAISHKPIADLEHLKALLETTRVTTYYDLSP